MGIPELAPVPIWEGCPFGITRLGSSFCTGRPVPAPGTQCWNWAHQILFFHPGSSMGHPLLAWWWFGGVCIPVPAWGEKSVPVPALDQCQCWGQHQHIYSRGKMWLQCFQKEWQHLLYKPDLKLLECQKIHFDFTCNLSNASIFKLVDH